MASPTILVTGQVPVATTARALAGRTVTAPAETVDQLIARINEQRQLGVQPEVQIIYRESRWNRVVNPAAVAAVLPAVIATLAEFTGPRATSQAALVVAVLLASLAGFALVVARVERDR